MKTITITYETDNEAMKYREGQERIVIKYIEKLFKNDYEPVKMYDDNGNAVGKIEYTD